MNTEANTKLRADFESWVGVHNLATGLKWDEGSKGYYSATIHNMWCAYKVAHSAQQAIIDRLLLENDQLGKIARTAYQIAIPVMNEAIKILPNFDEASK